jgi:hypothetical protein
MEGGLIKSRIVNTARYQETCTAASNASTSEWSPTKRCVPRLLEKKPHRLVTKTFALRHREPLRGASAPSSRTQACCMTDRGAMSKVGRTVRGDVDNHATAVMPPRWTSADNRMVVQRQRATASATSAGFDHVIVWSLSALLPTALTACGGGAVDKSR